MSVFSEQELQRRQQQQEAARMKLDAQMDLLCTVFKVRTFAVHVFKQEICDPGMYIVFGSKDSNKA